MEITGIASQFAMQSRPIRDASSNMRRKHCDALLGYSSLRYYFSSIHLVSDLVAIFQGTRVVHQRPGYSVIIKLSSGRLQGCSDEPSL